MPVRERPGKRQVNFWIDEKDHAAWLAFLESRPGATLTGEVVTAMARHMANPPPLPGQVPLPAPKKNPKKKH